MRIGSEGVYVIEKYFNLEKIKQIWTPAVGDKDSERSVWDRNAVTYRDRPMPTPDNVERYGVKNTEFRLIDCYEGYDRFNV